MKDGDKLLMKWQLKQAITFTITYTPDWIYWLEYGKVNGN